MDIRMDAFDSNLNAFRRDPVKHANDTLTPQRNHQRVGTGPSGTVEGWQQRLHAPTSIQESLTRQVTGVLLTEQSIHSFRSTGVAMVPFCIKSSATAMHCCKPM